MRHVTGTQRGSKQHGAEQAVSFSAHLEAAIRVRSFGRSLPLGWPLVSTILHSVVVTHSVEVMKAKAFHSNGTLYWGRQLREPVLLAGVRTVRSCGTKRDEPGSVRCPETNAGAVGFTGSAKHSTRQNADGNEDIPSVAMRPSHIAMERSFGSAPVV